MIKHIYDIYIWGRGGRERKRKEEKKDEGDRRQTGKEEKTQKYVS